MPVVYGRKDCRSCGVSFEPSGPNSRYCSRPCSERTPRAPWAEERRCRVCAATYLAHNARSAYCSTTCKRSHTPGGSPSRQLDAIRAKRARAVATLRTCRVCLAEFEARGSRRRCRPCGDHDWVARVPCPWCSVTFFARRGQVHCSRDCADSAWHQRRPVAQAPSGKGHRGRAVRYGVPYQPVNRRKVFDRDGWTCQICFARIDPKVPWPEPLSASLDHVQPISLGGAHSYGNVRASHLSCNIRKGTDAPHEEAGRHGGQQAERPAR